MNFIIFMIFMNNFNPLKLFELNCTQDRSSNWLVSLINLGTPSVWFLSELLRLYDSKRLTLIAVVCIDSLDSNNPCSNWYIYLEFNSDLRYSTLFDLFQKHVPQLIVDSEEFWAAKRPFGVKSVQVLEYMSSLSLQLGSLNNKVKGPFFSGFPHYSRITSKFFVPSIISEFPPSFSFLRDWKTII